MRSIGRGVAMTAVLAAVVTTGGWFPMTARLAHAASDVPGLNPLSGNSAAIREGQSWFRAVCSPCHGGRADGSGERGQGANLRVFNKGFKKFVETVKDGRDVPGRIQKMPPWGAVLSDQQIFQIGAYLETLAEQGANWKEGVSN